MRNTNKKGFTIVELVIVVAVIAILAAVLIPTFSGIIRKANESKDIQVARVLNTTLATNEVIGGEPGSFYAVMQVLREGGYLISNLNPSASGNYYAWDSATNQILYLDGSFNVIYQAKDLEKNYSKSNWYIAVTDGDDVAAIEAAGINVVMADAYAAEELQTLIADAVSDSIANGSKVTISLESDLYIDNEGGSEVLEFFTIPAGADVEIDLNGHDIGILMGDATNHQSIFSVKKGANLTISGEGTINACMGKNANNVSAIIYNQAGNVTINGGTFVLDAPSSWQVALIPTIVDNNSTLGTTTLTINGGEFTFTRNMIRNFANHKSEACTININGGTFNGEADDFGTIWSQAPSGTSAASYGTGFINVNGGTFNYVNINNEHPAGNVVISSGVKVDVVND